MDDLVNRKIKNYLRKKNSNNNKIRNLLLGLYYKTIDNIPIYIKIDENSDYYNVAISKFPYYFRKVNRDIILEIFNKEVSSRKILNVNYNENDENNKYDYNIKANNNLIISSNTFRPYYYEDWKERASIINEVDIKKQNSYYNDYLRYFIKFKKFPVFNEFISFIYNKYEKPLHKDILNVYNNIYNSYKDIISNTEYSADEIRKRIIETTSIKKRIEIQ